MTTLDASVFGFVTGFCIATIIALIDRRGALCRKCQGYLE
jgi:hypothetical protein